MGPIALVAKSIGKGIGLAQEYRACQKADQAKAQSPDRNLTPSDSRSSQDDSPPDYHSDPEDDEEYDTEDWELDEAQRELAPPAYAKDDALSGDDGVDVDVILQSYFNKHATIATRSELKPLPAPVILPQRRPKANNRGFLRAYAPVLQDSGINQAEWMDFLNGFHKAIKMSPYFHAVNGAVAIASTGLQFAGIAVVGVQVASIALHISIEASRRGYTRYSTNKYLDAMNERLFKPLGLYAMIMSYKPDSSNAAEVIDLNTHMARSVVKRVDGKGSKLSSSSGESREMQLPQAAPLIFPELEDASSKSNAFKKGGAFLADYSDRKAQALFERDNPHSKLNIEGARPQFASKFADPNHPMYDGGLAAFISGGKVEGTRTKRARGRGLIDPETGRPMPRQKREKPQKSRPLAMVKRALKEDVIYLTVVNLPSEEELAQASKAMKDARLFETS